jgi:hypothetical protein
MQGQLGVRRRRISAETCRTHCKTSYSGARPPARGNHPAARVAKWDVKAATWLPLLPLWAEPKTRSDTEADSRSGERTCGQPPATRQDTLRTLLPLERARIASCSTIVTASTFVSRCRCLRQALLVEPLLVGLVPLSLVRLGRGELALRFCVEIG